MGGFTIVFIEPEKKHFNLDNFTKSEISSRRRHARKVCKIYSLLVDSKKVLKPPDESTYSK